MATSSFSSSSSSSSSIADVSEAIALTHSFVKLSDLLLRGSDLKAISTANLDQYKESADRFLYLCHNIVPPSESMTGELIEMSVKLFNSIRNIPNQAGGAFYNALKSKLKLAIGTIIMRLKKPHSGRSLEIVIKLFYQSADRESLGLQNNIKCFEGLISAWDLLNQHDFISNLSHSVTQDIKLAVFKAFVGLASLIIELRVPESAEIARRNLVRAQDIAQGMPPSFKVDYAEASLQIGTALADVPLLLPQSPPFFSLSISALTEIKTSAVKSPNLDIETVLELLIRSTLTLSYVHMELGHFDRARSCVHMLDETFGKALAKFGSTILYAKYSIAAKDSDWTSADKHFRDLISNDISFEMAADCIQNYIKSSKGEREGVIDSYFKVLAAKFPSGSSYNALRILQCQYVLSHFNDEANNSNRRGGIDLCKSIVREHISRERTLEQDHLETLFTVISNQVRYHCSQKLWSQTIMWCDLGLNLIESCPEWSLTSSLSMSSSSSSSSATSMNKRNFFEFIKCDGLVNVGAYKEAYDLSRVSFSTSKTIKSAVQVFHCGLLFFKPRERALSVFIDEINSQFENNVAENCSRMLLCYDATRNLPISNSFEIKEIRIKILYRLLVQVNETVLSASSSHDAASLLKSIGAPPLTLVYILLIEFLENHFVIESNSNCNTFHAIESVAAASSSTSEMSTSPTATSATTTAASGGGNSMEIHQLEDCDVRDIGDAVAAETPHSFFNYSIEDNRSHFNCSIEDFYSIVAAVSYMPDVLKLIDSDVSLDEEIESIGDVIWNLALLIGREDVEFKGVSKSIVPARRQIISAELYELAAKYYSNLQAVDVIRKCNNCCLCFYASSNARLHDTQASIVAIQEQAEGAEGGKINSDSSFFKSTLENIQIGMAVCARGEELVRKILSLQPQEMSCETKGLRDYLICNHVLLMLKEHSLLGKKFNNLKILENEIGIFDLTSNGLFELANRASEEASVCSEFLRSLYSMSLQIAHRESTISLTPIVGQIYKRLINLSSSKEVALEVVIQVVQQLQSESENDNTSNCNSNINSKTAMNCDDAEKEPKKTFHKGMACEDINSICAMTYNAGVTLVELGSIALAQKFFDYSAILLNYTSHSQSKLWTNVIKEARKNILVQQSNSNSKPILLNEVCIISSRKESTTIQELLFNKPLILDTI